MDGLYPTASTFKIPILYSLYRMADRGEVALDERIRITEKHLVPGSGVLQHMRTGIEPSIYDLAILMTIVSDNQATDILHGMVGADRIHADLEELGLTHTRVPLSCRQMLFSMVGLNPENPEHTYDMFLERGRAQQYDRKGVAFSDKLESGNDLTSPREMAQLCEYIEQGTGLTDASREGVVDTLRRQQLNNRIPAGLPPGTISAHKTGSLKGVRNDAGIVYAKQPYVISLYSKNLPDERAGEITLVSISAAIWEAFGGE
jgi:beta-lactamase class A